jgi:hypothetical protein
MIDRLKEKKIKEKKTQRKKLSTKKNSEAFTVAPQKLISHDKSKISFNQYGLEKVQNTKGHPK